MIAALAATVAAGAKDLKTEITVDRTVVPVEREATRLGGISPVLMQPQTDFRRLTLVEYGEPSELTSSITPLEPASYGDTIPVTPYRGYASAGYFPAYNLGLSAGYRFINTSRTRLGAWMQFDGESYKTKAEDVEGRERYSDNTATVGVRFDHHLNRAMQISAVADFTYAGIKTPEFMLIDDRSALMFGVKAGLWAKRPTFGYHASLGVNRFGFLKDVEAETMYLDSPLKATGETNFSVTAGIGYYGSSATPRGGIEIAADMVRRGDSYKPVWAAGTPFDFWEIKKHSASTIGVISMTPYYAFNAGRAHGRIGARIDLSTGGEGKKFHIAPAVMLDWNASSQFALYARAEGGEHLNTLRSLYNYCPYMNTLMQYERSHVPVNVEIGANIGMIAGFSAKLFGGYAVANDWLMPTMVEGSSDGIDCDAYTTYDLKAWHAGLTLAYDWRSIVSAEVTGEVAPQKADKAYYLWRDRAKYVLTARLKVRPIDRLEIGADFELRAKRCFYGGENPFGDAGRVSLGDSRLLGVNATYGITEALSVFARGENLLGHRYQLVPGIESAGVKGLVGVSYKF